MIDKLNNINAGNAQNKRVSDNSKEKVSSSKSISETSDHTNKASNVKISSELNLKGMSSEAPIDTVKVSAIKEAISKGDYPINLDKVAFPNDPVPPVIKIFLPLNIKFTHHCIFFLLYSLLKILLSGFCIDLL